MPLVVTGSIGIDTVKTPRDGSRENVLGGSCTYFAAAASFYTPTRLVAAVGDDFPDEFEETMTSFAGVDLAGLERRAGSKTFRWSGEYMDDMDQRETLSTELGVLGEAPPTPPEAFGDSEFVFLANGHPAAQAGFLEHFPRRRLVVADTMDLWINIAKDDLKSLLGKVDGLALNFDEAELYTGKRNPVTAGRRLLDEGPKFVIIKKGEHGSLFVHRDGIAAVPAFPAEEVVDPTGAGDSFAGGVMGHLASEGARDADFDPTSFNSVFKALAHGTVIASFTIASFSLERLRTLTREEIDQRFAQFVRMSHFDQ